MIKIMIYFLLAFFLTIVFTWLVKKISLKWKILDKPDGFRKQHSKPVPLLGGLAIFLSFWLIVAYLIFFTNLIGQNIQPTQLIGVFFGSCILMVVGFFDDLRGLPALTRLILSVAAVLLVLAGGVGLTAITNPLGGVFDLNIWQLDLGVWGTVVVLADLLVFFWLMGMMYTSKILDGLDGLSTGIVAIGAFMIFGLSNLSKFYQPDTALIAIVLAGACLGFLIFNFYPAKIFLGEGGSLFLGFALGVLAVIAGGKFATALLVMAVPVMDLIRVIYVRLSRKQHIFQGDREHLHFRLLKVGLSERQTVLWLYLIAFLFGLTTLFFQSQQKLIALIFLAIVMIISIIWLGKKERK